MKKLCREKLAHGVNIYITTKHTPYVYRVNNNDIPDFALELNNSLKEFTKSHYLFQEEDSPLAPINISIIENSTNKMLFSAIMVGRRFMRYEGKTYHAPYIFNKIIQLKRENKLELIRNTRLIKDIHSTVYPNENLSSELRSLPNKKTGGV